jgi:hypothetical protein
VRSTESKGLLRTELFRYTGPSVGETGALNFDPLDLIRVDTTVTFTNLAVLSLRLTTRSHDVKGLVDGILDDHESRAVINR